MSEVSPTRTNLLARRAQTRLARQGIALLKKKREALVREFLSLLRDFAASRGGLEEDLHRAYYHLFITRSVDGEEAVRSLAAATEPDVRVQLESRRVWGIAVPKVKRAGVRPEILSQDIALPATSARLARAKEGFERILDDLVELASSEILIRRLGNEISKTSRRVNALEQILVPRLEREQAYIRAVLEEREREDKTRLKRIKAKSKGKGQSPIPAMAGMTSPGKPQWG